MWDRLTDEERAWKGECAAFAREIIAPAARRWDERNAFPREIHEEAAARGLLNVGFPADLGGRGLSWKALVVGGEELATACAPIAFTMGFNHGSLRPITVAGTEAQRARLVGDLIARGGYASIAMTEPDRSGSNLLALDTTARRTADGGWSLDGVKCMVGNGARSDLFVVLAEAHDGERRLGPTFFAVPRGAGVSVGPNTEKIGFRCLTTPTIRLEGAVVSDDDRIGEVGGAETVLARTLDVIRLGGTAVILGIAVGALREVVPWLSQRRVFPDEPLITKSHVRLEIGELFTEVRAVRHFLWDAAERLDRGEAAHVETSMAKLRASRLAVDATNRILQLYGWRGLDAEWTIQKRVRDARVTTIYEGTSEVQLLMAFREARRSVEQADGWL